MKVTDSCPLVQWSRTMQELVRRTATVQLLFFTMEYLFLQSNVRMLFFTIQLHVTTFRIFIDSPYPHLPLSEPLWMQSHCSLNSSGRANVISHTHYSLSLFCHTKGVGNFDLMPTNHTNKHTNAYTHSIWPHLIWHPWCPGAWTMGQNAGPKCHSCPVTLVGGENISHPSGPLSSLNSSYASTSCLLLGNIHQHTYHFLFFLSFHFEPSIDC